MASSKSFTSENKKPAKRSADQAEIAFERLRQAILTNELREGDRVRETRLAADWGIGITPLREAVRRMAAIGYLILEPNHAPRVRKLSADDIVQIYGLREVLECYALRSAWEEIRKADLGSLQKLIAKAEAAKSKSSRLRAQFALDSELHELWISPQQNPWLASSLERLIIYRPNLLNVVSKHTAFSEKAFEQHKKILAAIEAQNLEKSIQLLGHHIQTSGAALATLTNH